MTYNPKLLQIHMRQLEILYQQLMTEPPTDLLRLNDLLLQCNSTIRSIEEVLDQAAAAAWTNHHVQEHGAVEGISLECWPDPWEGMK